MKRRRHSFDAEILFVIQVRLRVRVFCVYVVDAPLRANSI